MGGGLAQVGILAVLTVIVLPCCFFTLLALLDRFERTLTPDATKHAADAKPVPALVAATPVHTAIPEPVSADVVALPVPLPVTLPMAAAGKPAVIPGARSAATG